MIHFVVIGLGSIGRRHVTNLAAVHPDARFTFVRRAAGHDEVAGRHDARVVNDLREVLDDEIDLAVVATPSANHIDVLPTLIDRGCPLLVEKPIVADAVDCDALEDQLLRAPAAVRVAGFNLRHQASIQRMKRHLDAGDVGRPVRASFVAGQWLPDWRPDTDYRAGYSADARRGGGVELDLCHEFDLARWFFGELVVDFARTGHLTDLEIESSDTAVAVLSPAASPNPVIAVMLDYVARRRVRRYEVVGDRGTLTWDIDGTLTLSTADGVRVVSDDASEFDLTRSYVEMVRAVLAATGSGDEHGIQSLADGLASTRLALEVRREGASR